MGLVKRKIVFFYDFLPGSTTFVLWRTAKTWMQPSTQKKDTFKPSNETVFDEKTVHGRKQMYKWECKAAGARSFVQPLRRFAPAPRVGEPLASRCWLYWTSEVFRIRKRPGSAVEIHGCLPSILCQGAVSQLLSIRTGPAALRPIGPKRTAGLARPAKGSPIRGAGIAKQ